MERQQDIEYWVSVLTTEQQRLKLDISTKRKIFLEASKALKETCQEKNKSDTPTIATIENIFLDYEISPAMYHGGKLNGAEFQKTVESRKLVL
jgi:hypothetical protein